MTAPAGDEFEALGDFLAMRANSSGQVMASRAAQRPHTAAAPTGHPPTADGTHHNPKVAEFVQIEESGILKDSQQTIERQRMAIRALQDSVERIETQRAELNVRHSDEVRMYVDENERLRLQMDGLKAEVAALSESQIAQDETVRRLTDNLRSAEYAVADRDAKLSAAHASLSRLPQENQQLREEYGRVQANYEKLKTQVNSSTSGTWQEEYEQAQNEVDRLTFQLNATEGHRAELAATRKALLQLESEIADYQIVTEKQRVEIERLYKVVVAMDKEKTLVPPVVLAAPRAPGLDADAELALRDKILSLKTGSETEQEFNRLAQRIEQIVETKIAVQGNRGLSEQQLKSMTEQRNLIVNLSDAVNKLSDKQTSTQLDDLLVGGVYQADVVQHTIIDKSSKHPPKFKAVAIAVRQEELIIYNDPKGRSVRMVMDTARAKLLPDQENNQLFVEYKPSAVAPIQVHAFKFKNADEFQRWRHSISTSGCAHQNETEPVTYVAVDQGPITEA